MEGMSSSATGGRQPILAVAGLAKSFAGLLALQDFSLTMAQGEIVGLIGPNGAGKTTCFNVITGFLVPTAGQIQFGGQNVTGLQPAQTARLGMARTFQNIRLFGSLTVLENVQVAAQLHQRARLLQTLLGLPSFHRRELLARQQAVELLELLGLQAFAPQAAGSLPYGLQRRLEIARALATQPSLLLLDEPAAGMNPSESDDLHHLILRLRERFNLTVLLVEHDMRLVMNLCERIVVLNYGGIIAQGTPGEVRNDPQVIAAYLGQQQGEH
jgi:branched-chain amino acid transport system ATP-binding protein